MGADKARIAWPGRWPMAAWVAAVIARVVPDVSIVRSAPDPVGFSFPVEPWVIDPGAPIRVVVDDPALPRHPLRGVATALRSASGRVLLAACDLARLDAAAVAAVVGAGRPVVAVGEGERFGLLAVLDASDADRAAALARTGAGFRELVRGLPAVPVGAALDDVDTPPPSGPIATLCGAVPRIDARILAGERGRLAARGAVDPGPDRV